jgi:2,4-dienoyl-CoA reductase-like NADH-dependent reductase (Old Yellow Enzyme family)/thioredoxin reductase
VSAPAVAAPAGRYPRLFSPGRIGRLALRNRILMAPMEKNLALPTGAVTRRYVDYCEARAAGGAALILLESMFVHPAGRNHRYQLGLHDDALVPGYRRLVAACHRLGARVGAQLQFAGRETSSRVTGTPPVAPSAVPCTALTGGEMPRPLAAREIEALVAAFAAAARRAVAAGFDAVEIHGAHGYLVGQFLSPFANRRDDAWGGDFERRLRFPLAVIRAVREAVGPALPLLFRLSADEHVPGGLGLADACRIAPRLAAAGIDLIDVSAGIYESAPWIVQPMELPRGCLVPLAREIRRHAGIPVSVAGRISDAALAEEVLAGGASDFVTLGRALHADPELPRKSAEGREDEIVPCVACLSCSDLLGRDEPVLCLANTRSGRERQHALRPAARRQRVLVVGAGPAGLEAARVLALRGHRVRVLERAAEPGGQLRLARTVPGRADLAALAAYLAGAAARAGAEIRLGVEATVELVTAARPDAVVLATGARPALPALPGIEDSPAVDAFTVLERPGGRVRRALVLGGGMLGVAVAHVLAERGAEVVVAEPGPTLAAELGVRPRWQHVADLSARPEVRVLLETALERLEPAGALLRRAGETLALEGLDLVVPTGLMVPAGELGEALAADDGGPAVFEVGDAARPRTAFEAMQEAAALGHRL